IEEIVQTVGLDYVQLHGDETPDFVNQLPYPVIKAFQVRSEKDLEQLESYNCDYYLLDSPAGKYRGGNGETFDWNLAKSFDFLDKKVILAGGLTPENVAQAVQEVVPAGVDVSS